MGCETALYIAEALKKQVTVIEMLDDVLKDMEAPMNMNVLKARLKNAA